MRASASEICGCLDLRAWSLDPRFVGVDCAGFEFTLPDGAYPVVEETKGENMKTNERLSVAGYLSRASRAGEAPRPAARRQAANESVIMLMELGLSAVAASQVQS